MIKKNTFNRQQRLNTKTEFKKIFTHSHKLSSKNLLILWTISHQPLGKIGIIAGKKVSPHAVIRNQIKRIIRDSYRLANDELENLDMIIIARHSCRHLNKILLRKEIDELWQKLLMQYQKS